MTWMGWLAVGLAPSALVGVWAIWKNLKVKAREKTMRGYTGRTGPF